MSMPTPKKTLGNIRAVQGPYFGFVINCLNGIRTARFEGSYVDALEMVIFLIDSTPNKVYDELKKDVDKVLKGFDEARIFDSMKKGNPSYVATREKKIIQYAWVNFRSLYRRAITVLDQNNLIVQYSKVTEKNVATVRF